MRQSGLKQHDGMSGLIRRQEFLLVLILQPEDRLALKKNRRVMLQGKRDDIYLSLYSG